MQLTRGCRVGLTRLRVIDSQVRVWSFGGKQESQPNVLNNGYGWIGECQVSQWIAASYIISSQAGWV